MERKSSKGVAISWIFVVMALSIFLSSCGQSGKDKTYAYDDLDASQQAEVDFVMSKASVWDTDKCDRVGFTINSEGETLLCVNTLESYGSNRQEWYGWRIWYVYDTSSDTFREKDKIYLGNKMYNGSDHTKEWSHSWDTSTKKDYLANKLGRSRASD